jgi:hypothetical protein
MAINQKIQPFTLTCKHRMMLKSSKKKKKIRMTENSHKFVLLLFKREFFFLYDITNVKQFYMMKFIEQKILADLMRS